ncbi:Protein of unknown function [Lactobacillus acidophilus DSM 9126]|nr:Protein of unknown function [Lactobacillus acidophilus DSM 9126]
MSVSDALHLMSSEKNNCFSWGELAVI